MEDEADSSRELEMNGCVCGETEAAVNLMLFFFHYRDNEEDI